MRDSDRTSFDAPAFGRRRPAAHSPAVEPEPREPREWALLGRPAGPVRWALRIVALACFAAVVATQFLVRLSGPGEMAATRLALGPRPAVEPETTGSISRRGPAAAAQATRLDPCALAAPPRIRP